MGLFDWLFGTTTKQNQQTSNTFNQQGTSSASVNPAFSGLQDLLIKNIMGNLNKPVDLSGYEASSLGNIATTNAAAQQRMREHMANLGLAASPVLPLANENLNAGMANQQASLINSLPLLQRQMQMENMAQAMGLYGLAPRTTSTTSSGTSSGTMTGETTQNSGLGNQLAGLLGMLFASGSFGGTKGADPFGSTGLSNLFLEQ